jgi:hypothetical protein
MPLWLEIVLKVTPWLVLVAGLLLKAMRMIVDAIAARVVVKLTERDGAFAKLEEKVSGADFAMREEMQALTNRVSEVDTRLREVEAQSEIVWGMVRQATAGLLRDRR